eukprot:m.60115 g.60115  ORF g.60115 m.60115 type:complete len:517 (+) comp17407_c0_seq1:240-1790(+)
MGVPQWAAAVALVVLGLARKGGCCLITPTAGHITIPAAMTVIGNNSFQSCGTTLITVTFPDTVAVIGRLAFSGAGLTSVRLPNGLTELGSSAFSGCIALSSVTIPDSLTRLESSLWGDCVTLDNVIIPDSIVFISSLVFVRCVQLTSIRIPNSVTYIGNSAFGGTTGLRTLTLPAPIIIAGFAFDNYGCTIPVASGTTVCDCTAGTCGPTAVPSVSPTRQPSAVPTDTPTALPTTLAPTAAPTADPTASPTTTPSTAPMHAPTAAPTIPPTAIPTTTPTAAPSTVSPTAPPSTTPTTTPSTTRSAVPSTVVTTPPTAAAAGSSSGDGASTLLVAVPIVLLVLIVLVVGVYLYRRSMRRATAQSGATRLGATAAGTITPNPTFDVAEHGGSSAHPTTPSAHLPAYTLFLGDGGGRPSGDYTDTDADASPVYGDSTIVSQGGVVYAVPSEHGASPSATHTPHSPAEPAGGAVLLDQDLYVCGGPPVAESGTRTPSDAMYLAIDVGAANGRTTATASTT